MVNMPEPMQATTKRKIHDNYEVRDIYVRTRKTTQIELTITSTGIPDDSEEYLITLNGRVIARLHPYRAERLGLIERA